MKDKLKAIWANVTPRQKRNLVLLAMATLVLAFSLAGYLFKTRDGGTASGKSAQALPRSVVALPTPKARCVLTNSGLSNA